ncbi:MAG TPA: 4Fe-4S binding protein [Coriobacteriia bacterium]
MHVTCQIVRRGTVVGFFLLLPITLNYYSPYLMTSGTAERVASFSLFFWLAIFVASPLVGRLFCGWACPFNGVQTAWEVVGVHKLVEVRWLPIVKYVLWVAWAGAVVGIAIAVGGWQRAEPLYMTEHVVSIDQAGNLITYFLLVGLALAPAALGRRGFCRYLCPFGVWAIVGEKIGHALHVPRVMLVADAAKCTQCGTYDRACPMQLPVSEMVAQEHMRATECFSCGSCADGCKKGAIRWGFGGAK